MIEPRVTRAQPRQSKADPGLVAGLPLPSHVVVWADGCWRRGWLIGRSHEPTGWMGLVQYDDRSGHEVTEQLPVEHIAPADF